MTPQERINAIKEKQKEVERLKKEIMQLVKTCPHQFKPLSAKELADQWMSVGAYCLVCNKDFGWRCKESPDGVCHYFTENGKVRLINDELVDPPAEHDPNYETDDGCIWCGHPDERK